MESLQLKAHQSACRKQHRKSARRSRRNDILFLINKIPGLKLDCTIKHKCQKLRKRGTKYKNISKSIYFIYFLMNGGRCQAPYQEKASILSQRLPCSQHKQPVVLRYGAGLKLSNVWESWTS